MDNTKVTINGKEYAITPLRCKHLKAISKIMKDGKIVTKTYEDLERFAPMIVDSIKSGSPDFTQEELEEATLPEYLEAWQAIIGLSGARITPGEQAPAEA